jgi:hypothetical protein
VISWSCSKQCRDDEAEKFGRRVLEYKTKALGAEEEETIKAMTYLAYVLANARKYDEAGKLNTRAIDICNRVRGPPVEQLLPARSQLA